MKRLPDLDPAELAVDRLLSAVTPQAPPLGFRDAVMRGVLAERRQSAWEWIVVAAFALPSLAFLAWAAAVYGGDFAAGLNGVFAAAAGETTEVFFFVDGLVVLAVALCGLAGAVAAHALLAATPARSAR